MHVFRIVTAALLFCSLSWSQDPGSQQPKPATQPNTEKESVNRPLTPEERIAILKKELEKLERERDFLQKIEKDGGIVTRVKGFVLDRKISSQEVKDTTVREMAASQPVRKKARLLGDAEKERFGAEVVMTVDDLPVTKAELEDFANYLKSYMTDSSDEALKTRAVLELIRARAAEASFKSSAPAALGKIESVTKELAAGKSFEDLAKAHSDCPSKAQGGDLGRFGREGMDASFSKVAFTLKVGETSKVVRTAFGYHLIKVTAQQKGAAPAQDTVQASHILAMYGPDQMAVRNAQMRVNNGEADVAFANDEWRKLAPPMFQ